jgi:hypothetical protein
VEKLSDAVGGNTSLFGRLILFPVFCNERGGLLLGYSYKNEIAALQIGEGWVEVLLEKGLIATCYEFREGAMRTVGIRRPASVQR